MKGGRKKMDEQKSPEAKGGNVSISGGSIGGSQIVTGGTFSAQGDIVIGQKIDHDSDVSRALAEWQARMNAEIESHPSLSHEDKNDLKEQVGKIQNEAAKGMQADPGRLEKLINTLAVMASDIFDVAITTLASPLAGIGLVAKKIGDKARLERKSA
jgi:hypothetical protein